MDIINVCCGIWTVFSLIGLGIYKWNPEIAPSWEAGIKKAVTYIFEMFYEELSGKRPVEQMIQNIRILDGEEIKEFLYQFEGHPYDTPTYQEPPSICQDICWYDIGAVGLISRYQDIENTQIRKIVTHVIQNYFMEKRGIHVPIFIRIATPTRLYLAIPLSESARKFLQKQEEESAVQLPIRQESKPLEEEIDFFADDEL